MTQLATEVKGKLNVFLERIYGKALPEQTYRETYGHMCYHLKGLNVLSERGELPILLLRKCQREFQKVQQSEPAVAEARKKDHQRSLGLMNFTGELFKLQMISKAILCGETPEIPE